MRSCAAVRSEMLQLARVDGAPKSTAISTRRWFHPRRPAVPNTSELLAPLVRMHRAAHDVWYVYTGVYRDGRIYWVLDTALSLPRAGQRRAGRPDHDAVRRHAIRPMSAPFATALEFTDLEPRLDDGHYYLSAAVPIRDSHGKVVAMLGIDMVLDALDARMASCNAPWYRALLVVLLLSVAAGAVAHRLRQFAAAIVFKLRNARARCRAQRGGRGKSRRRAKAAFLAMMSHEIRTPMNGMLGVADLLRTMSPDPEQKKLLDILGGSGESLLRIINDILDFSKIEAERLELRPRPFEVRALLDELGHVARGAGARQTDRVRHRRRSRACRRRSMAIASGSRRSCSTSAPTP